MTRRTRRLFPTLSALSGAALLAPVTTAGDYEVLDYVPANASVVIAIDDLQATATQLQEFATRFAPDDQSRQMIDLAGFQAGNFLRTPGFNGSGSLAIVIKPEAISAISSAIDASMQQGFAGPPPVDPMALLPHVGAVISVDNALQMAQSLGGRREGDYIVIGGGMLPFEAYMKPMGDKHAAIAATPGFFEGLEDGNMAAHADRIGAVGVSTLGDSGIFIAADVGALSQGMPARLEMLNALAGQQAQAMGPQGAQITAVASTFTELAGAFFSQGETMLAGINLSEQGLVVDLGASFRDGSEIAGFFAESGESDEVIARLPDVPFMFAYGLETEQPGRRELVQRGFELARTMAGDQAGAMALAASFASANRTGQLTAVSENAGMGMALIADQVNVVFADDPASIKRDFRSALEAMSMQNVQGVSFSSQYAEGETTIGGVKADGYSFAMNMDAGGPGMMMDPNMVNQMLFGPTGGPNGFVMTTDDALVSTGSRNEALAEAALMAAKNGGGLGSNALVQASASMLPDGRFFEGYIAVDQIFNMAAPIAAAFGQAPLEPVEAFEPIAVGAVADDGGVRATLFVPNGFFDFATVLAGQIAELGGPLDAGFDAPADNGPAGDRPARPRF